MDITNVRVRITTRDDSKLRAVASITIDDCFVIHDIKIVEGAEGYFIAMPSRKAANGEYKDIAHPINSETREVIRKTVITAYEQKKIELAAEAAATTTE